MRRQTKRALVLAGLVLGGFLLVARRSDDSGPHVHVVAPQMPRENLVTSTVAANAGNVDNLNQVAIVGASVWQMHG